MNRNDLRLLADIRLREAKLLLNQRLYDGAYYLTGYAIECGLKSCIAKKTRRHDFPDRRIVNDSYTHDLDQLIRVSGLQRALELEIKRDKTFERNWATAKDWNENSRYLRHDPSAAKNLYAAVADGKHGVLRWLRLHW